MEKVRVNSNLDEHLSVEKKHYVMMLINRYREIQDEQNTLIEREKIRLVMMKEELGSKENSVRKLRNRLKYLVALNKDHEDIITHIKEESRCFRSVVTNNNELRQR